MKSIPYRLGVETYCFREFKDNRDVIKQMKAAELSHVELCGMHADFSSTQAFAPTLKMYTDAEISIDAIFPPALRNDAKSEEPFYACAKMAGAQAICAHYGVVELETFRVAEQLAEKYDIRVAIHNHGGYHWLGSSEMIDYVLRRTSPRIGLCLDTAWAMAAGEDPLPWVERFAGRIYGVHIKDFIFDRQGRPEDIVCGKGNLNLGKLDAALRKIGFSGYAMLEYEGDADNPLPAIKECAAAVRKEFKHE